MPPVLIRARALMGVEALVTQMGGDCHALLKRAGISAKLLKSPEATLDHGKLIAFHELVAQTLGADDYGLRLAQLQNLNVLGPVALLALNSATVRDAIDAVHLFHSYHSPGGRIDLLLPRETPGTPPDGLACIRYQVQLPQDTPQRQNSELTIAIASRGMQVVSASAPDRWLVHFRHTDGLRPTQYRRYLGCPVKLGQSADALYFPRTLLDRPIDAADPALVSLASRFIANVIRRYPLDIAKQVETLLIRQLTSQSCTMPYIARQLSLSASTLRRRLALQGTSFDAIVDSVRRARADEYLRKTALPLTQVVNVLGYTESSTFNRACLRWFGVTPLTYRNRR